MSATDAFILIVRWLHITSAVAWIGGCIFFLAVLRPAAGRRAGSGRPGAGAAPERFRALVDLCIVVLIASGAILAFDRLTAAAATVPYVIVLAVKVALSAWMFVLVQLERRSSAVMAPYRAAEPAVGWAARPLALARGAVSGYSGITVIGIAVFLLSDMLRALFEIALRGG